MVKNEVLSFRRKKLHSSGNGKGYSQEDLSNLLGKGRTTITMYESNKIEPTVTVLYDIARALEVTVFDFLTDAEEDRFLHSPVPKGVPYVEDLKNKLKQLEIELAFLKRELNNKVAIIELHEKREAEYENRLKEIQELYAKIIGRLP